MSALEAAAFGCPIICTSRGGLPEIVEHGVTGIVVAPNRPEALADAVRRFLRDPGLLEQMGHAARHRAREKFSVDRFVAAFDQAIAALPHGRSAHTGPVVLAQ